MYDEDMFERWKSLRSWEEMLVEKISKATEYRSRKIFKKMLKHNRKVSKRIERKLFKQW